MVDKIKSIGYKILPLLNSYLIINVRFFLCPRSVFLSHIFVIWEREAQAVSSVSLALMSFLPATSQTLDRGSAFAASKPQITVFNTVQFYSHE